MNRLWAKTGKNGDASWHPLILHMLDVAASVDAILGREPESNRARLAACLGMDWEEARPWLLLVAACHDLGKACPGFQCKWTDAPATGLSMPRSPNTRINHAYVSQLALTELLQGQDWPEELAVLAADAVPALPDVRALGTRQPAARHTPRRWNRSPSLSHAFSGRPE